MEILPDFLVRKGEGYYCRYGDFYIDPLYPVTCALISHAHGDHASAGHRNIYATEFTVRFMQYRFPKQPESSYHPLDFHQKTVIRDIEIVFIPAGHILGSAQILMTYRGVRYLYTGDFKMQADVTCEPLEIVKADVLITETTFADPEVRHPDPIEEIQKLNNVPANILLGSYVLGKSQRITALINAHCPDRTVLVHHRIAPVHRLYDLYGNCPLRYQIYGRKDMKDGKTDKVYIVPPLTFNSYFRATKVVRVFASGWERLQRQNDLSLYISDHIDWSELLVFIQKVSPQEIWTIHGDGRHLRTYFKDCFTVRDILQIPVLHLANHHF